MYKLSNLAADDFAGIYEYTVLNFGVQQADKYTEEMELCLETLAGSPKMGRECVDVKLGVRRLDHSRHAIFYQMRELDIFIVRILHQQMEPMLHLWDDDNPIKKP